MGLFTQRPEDPIEWAGLPGEPLGPQDAASHLDESDEWRPDRVTDAPADVTSIEIQMPPRPETMGTDAAGTDGDGD
jgi:hypothetical protein